MVGWGMVSAKAFEKSNPSRARTRRRAGRMEDNFSESASPTFSHQLAELSLRTNANSISHVYALGFDWTPAGAFPVCLSRNAGAIRSQFGARQNSSARGRVLDLGRCICYYSASTVGVKPDRATHDGKIAIGKVAQSA